MDEQTVIRRLEELAPPEMHEARERAKLAARVALSQQPLGHRPQGQRPNWRRRALLRPWRSPRATALLLLLLAATFVALTATGPGEALAEWVGQQVGLGRPGGAPSLHRLRGELDSGTVAQGAPAYVLARGRLPKPGHYEFLGYRSNKNGEPCFELDLPATHNAAGGSCSALLGAHRALHIDSAGAVSSRVPPEVSGRVSRDVRSVEVGLGEETVSAELSPAYRPALRKLGLRRPFKVFVAFLARSDFEQGGKLTVTAKNAHGEPLVERALRLPDISGYGGRCKRLRLAGELRRALESCG